MKTLGPLKEIAVGCKGKKKTWLGSVVQRFDVGLGMF